jgi:hypothetical protein
LPVGVFFHVSRIWAGPLLPAALLGLVRSSRNGNSIPTVCTECPS